MPRRRVSNIASGKHSTSKIEGWAEMRIRLRDLQSAMVGPEINRVVGLAAEAAFSAIKLAAYWVRVPHEVFGDLFIYNRMRATDRSKHLIAALVGLRKRGRSRPYSPSYAEWFPGKRRRMLKSGKLAKYKRGTRGKASRLVRPGALGKSGLQKIGENLGTMWELGTNLMSAKPWFRPALDFVRARVLDMLRDGYSDIIHRYSKAA